MNNRLKILTVLALALSVNALAEEAAPSASKPAAAADAEAAPKKNKFVNRKKKVSVGTQPAATSNSGAIGSGRPRSSIESWLKRMKRRVGHAQARQNKLVAVAAVRGAEQPDAPPLYWKGSVSRGEVNAAELAQFDEALSTALAGDSAAAKAKLEAFLSAYPKSALAGDASETLKQLNEAP